MVTILLASAAALFVPTAPVTVGAGSGEVVLADLDHDGHLDLLTKHLLQRSVTIRLGQGDGRFGKIPDFVMNFAFQPGAIAVGDLDNDRIPDLGVASRDEHWEYVQVFRGNGSGGFAQPAVRSLRVSSSMKTYKPNLDFADLDEDGKLDIVVANGRRNTVEVLRADAERGFAPARAVMLQPGGSFYTFAVGDVDGDRHLDLVAVNSVHEGDGPGRLSIKRGDGKGGFSGTPEFVVAVPRTPRIAALADLNGDQYSDIVFTHARTRRLTIFLNRGDGTFTSSSASPHEIAGEAYEVEVADVDRDGRKDLVAATVNSVTVLLGNARGFAPAPGSPFRAGPGAYKLDLGDVNEDGNVDIVASSFEGTSITLLLGRPPHAARARTALARGRSGTREPR